MKEGKPNFKSKTIDEKGITLISLIITVIVLIILAGVGIGMALNNNGVFEKGNQVVSDTNKKIEQENDKVDTILNQGGIKKNTKPSLYFADTGEVAMNWEDLIKPQNEMLYINTSNGTLYRSNFDVESRYGSGKTYKLIIGNGVTNVSINGLQNLVEIVVPDNVTGFVNFAGCPDLERVTLGKNVTMIQSLSGTKIKKLVIPDTVTTINDAVFGARSSGNMIDNIEYIDFGNGISEIPDYLFSTRYNLKTVKLGSNVRRIGSNTFYACIELENIILPEGLEEIGVAAFMDCTKGFPKNVVLPNSITTIETQAFKRCHSIETFKIGTGITHIVSYLISYCNNLKSITIPTSVTQIDTQAFVSCPKLTDIYYEGTEAQWQNINIALTNDVINNATIHFAN